MPHVKISASESGNNQGSCSGLVNYLEKENQVGKGEKKAYGEREHFFSQSEDRVSIAEVIHKIDHNKAQLGKKDAKFFMLSVSPSESEIRHLGGDRSALKDYARLVMEEYAKNFSKGLKSENLVWYAKLEENRYYKGDDPEVKAGIVRSGEAKPGEQMHVHIIVSRKDATNKIKLSPLTAHRNTQKGHIRGGFDRVAFKQACEEHFDEQFGYARPLEERFAYHNTMKNGKPQERLDLAMQVKQSQQPEQPQERDLAASLALPTFSEVFARELKKASLAAKQKADTSMEPGQTIKPEIKPTPAQQVKPENKSDLKPNLEPEEKPKLQQSRGRKMK